jgi:hypothetical protein
MMICYYFKKRWPALLAAVGLVIAVVVHLLSHCVQPRVERAELSPLEGYGDTNKRVITYPLKYDSGNKFTSGVVELTLKPSLLGVDRYSVKVDDCLDWVEINGRPIPLPNLPYCNYSAALDLEFGRYLQGGTNLVRFGYRNFGGPGALRLEVASDHPYLIGARAVVTLALALFFLAVSSFLVKQVGLGAWFAVPFLLGVVLRFAYLSATPFDVRGYDWGGHIEYIEKFATTLKIPRISEGWQAYQPPLYYAVSGAVYRAAMLLGADNPRALESVQVLSAAMSIGFLYLSIVFIARLPFKGLSLLGRLLGAFFVAVLPSLVMAAARINNDSLVQLLTLAAFVALNSWYKTGSARAWYGSVVVLCLALLTKATALTLAPLYPILLVLSKRMRIREKFVLALGAVVIVSALLGWYVTYRFYEDGQRQIVANVSSLNAALKIDISPKSLLTFNPVEVFKHPYNNPWSDESRRSYFWEYLARGALFGEFNLGAEFRPYARALLVVLMLLGLFALAGSVVSLSVATLPLGLFFLLQLAGLVASRTQFPYSCSQDFRYILVAAMPFAFYAAQGCVAFSKGWRCIGVVLQIVFVILSCYFIYFV